MEIIKNKKDHLRQGLKNINEVNKNNQLKNGKHIREKKNLVSKAKEMEKNNNE